MAGVTVILKQAFTVVGFVVKIIRSINIALLPQTYFTLLM